MSQEKDSTLDSILKFIITVVIITTVLTITEAIGAALGIWLWVGWGLIYLKLGHYKLNYTQEFNAGHYYVPTNSTDTGIHMVFDGAATHDTVFGFVLFAMFGIAIVSAIGFMSFGSRWKKGLFWFWTPIFTLPLYLYVIGIIQYFPGGSAAYVRTYYQSECNTLANGKEQCVWHGPVTKPPF